MTFGPDSTQKHTLGAAANSPTPATAIADADPLAASGLVIVDKPAGMTSHDVVSRLRRIFHTRKVGHAGTLDPMATGVLVAGIERGTRFLAHLVAEEKTYVTTIRLGAATTTDDAEGIPVSMAGAAEITADDVLSHIPSFTGVIQQRPSSVSAIKIAGRRAHELVRAGVEVNIPAREVTIMDFDVTSVTKRQVPRGDIATSAQSYAELHPPRPSRAAKKKNRKTAAENDVPAEDTTAAVDDTAARYAELVESAPVLVDVIDVEATIRCSSGTYIRSLGRDLGEALGVGGHLTALRRTSVGPFEVSQAKSLAELEDTAQLTMSLDEAIKASFPVLDVTSDEAHALALGKWLPARGLQGVHAAVAPDGRVIALITESGKRLKTTFVARPSTM